jgi:hypothetical protein
MRFFFYVHFVLIQNEPKNQNNFRKLLISSNLNKGVEQLNHTLSQIVFCYERRTIRHYIEAQVRFCVS